VEEVSNERSSETVGDRDERKKSFCGFIFFLCFLRRDRDDEGLIGGGPRLLRTCNVEEIDIIEEKGHLYKLYKVKQMK
jgi:hypothetical protein